MFLPIGIDDFRKLITHKSPSNPDGYEYVDKSLFIKEIIDESAEVLVLLRPRRFGKTLNLSMLQHFFAAEVSGESTAGLFDGLAISKESAYMDYQGKSPIIFLTFKDIKVSSFASCIKMFEEIIAQAYREHRKIIVGLNLPKDEQMYVDAILEKKATLEELSFSIKRLTELLRQHYNVEPILLIDEYDTPLQMAYLKGYYQEAVDFMRNLFSAGLKGNRFIQKAVLTGILRVAKESLFSGISNVKIYSVLDKKYTAYFGFTEQEVDKLICKAELTEYSEQVKRWYNGYNFGKTTIYNPWSIINFLENEEHNLQTYWVNTSDNKLVEKLVTTMPEIQQDFAALIAGDVIEQKIDENIVFSGLDKNLDAVWSLLLLSGYLTWNSYQLSGTKRLCLLRLPNKEVEGFYTDTIEEWISGKHSTQWYSKFLADLAEGRVAAFEEKLQTLVTQTFSYHDVSTRYQESFYQGLMLAFVSGLKDSYVIKSNKESGTGRYDIALIPKDPKRLGIIIELKAVPNLEGLEKTATEALGQIKNHQYVAELVAHGISRKVLMGIACAGKKIKIIATGDIAAEV